jgi:predicted short-subunit dehydrogenase-like oxidoreductase (DUF2520 family)
VGSAVSQLLSRRGHEIVGVASRSKESAGRAAEQLATRAFELDPDDLPDADVVLLGVPDDALEELVGRFAPVARPQSVWWHVSGASGLEPLRPVIEHGVHGCAAHPMQACPTVAVSIDNLPRSAWGITASSPIQEWARWLVEDELDGIAIEIAEKDRPMWHAASITTSTGINAVLALGEGLLDAIGIDRPDEALRPLVLGTLKHSFESRGGRRTITGPVVRGEDDVLVRHLEAIRHSGDAGLVRDYLAVASLVLERAADAQRIEEDTAERMRTLLSTTGGDD